MISHVPILTQNVPNLPHHPNVPKIEQSRILTYLSGTEDKGNRRIYSINYTIIILVG